MVRTTDITRLLFCLLCGGGLFNVSMASALETPWTKHPEARFRMIAAQETIGADNTLSAAFEIIPEPGWKTYWRSPGFSGMGPEIQWHTLVNAEPQNIQFPWPDVFSSLGEQTIGYQSRVVLPLPVHVHNVEGSARLHGTIYYQVCAQICVPLQAEVRLTVPPGPPRPSPHAREITDWQNSVPDVLAAAPDGTSAWREDGQIWLQTRGVRLVDQPSALIEGPYGLSAAATTVHVSEDRRGARFGFDLGRSAKRFDGKPARITLRTGTTAYDFPILVRK